MKYQNFSVEDLVADDHFVKWVKGSDASVSKFWEDWLLANPDQEAKVAEARLILQNLDFESHAFSPDDKSALWAKIDARISEPPTAKVVGWRAIPVSLKVAATVLVLAMTSFLGWQLLRDTTQVLTTAYSEQKEITLSDGTFVVLNANSTLTYDERSPREVRLEGEAYFEVAKKPSTGAKFFVETADLEVQVLGTIFNVNSRGESTEVFLEEGKVNLSLLKPEAETIEMVPGDLVRFSSKSQELQEEKNAIALDNTSWKDGTLMFRDIPLPQVLKDLTEIYGVTFRLENEGLKQKIINGGVPIKSLDIAISTLTGIYHVEIEAQHDSTEFIIR